MNLYISSTFFKDNTPFSLALEKLISNKIYNIEIGSNHCYENNYDYLNISKCNFLLHNYFPVPKNDLVVNIASQDVEIRNESLKHIYNSIDFCKKINSKLYTFHPGFLTDPSGANLSSNNYDFQWNNNNLNTSNYNKSINTMYFSLEKIIKYSQKRKVKISIETEGSLNKKNHLLMQEPNEYINLFDRFTNKEIGINLNIGHLFLASKAFNFKKSNFINLIQKYIVAFELSHNNGIEDQHLPLKPNEWYWEIIFDKRFEKAYKILEYRNVDIVRMIENINLFKKNYEKFSEY